MTKLFKKENLPFLLFTGGSIATSLALQLMGKKRTSNFIGLWAPTILSLGLMQKVSKCR